MRLRREARKTTRRQGLKRPLPLWATMAAALCVTFAGVTLGRGLPFVVEGAVFIFVFTTVFSWRSWREGQRVARGAIQALMVAVLASTVIAWLFESVCLVRLP